MLFRSQQQYNVIEEGIVGGRRAVSEGHGGRGEIRGVAGDAFGDSDVVDMADGHLAGDAVSPQSRHGGFA